MGSYNNMDMDSLIWTYGFIPPYPSCRASQVARGKESTYNAGDMGSIPRSGRSPRKGKWQPTSVFLPGKSHGQRSLVGYSPGGSKESDMTERLSIHTHRFTGKENQELKFDFSNLIKDRVVKSIDC